MQSLHIPQANQCWASLRAMTRRQKLHFFFLPFYCWAWRLIVRNNLSTSLGHLSQLCPLPIFAHPQLLTRMEDGRAKKERKTQYCASTIQQQPKPGWQIQNSTLQGAMKKMDSVPARSVHYLWELEKKEVNVCTTSPIWKGDSHTGIGVICSSLSHTFHSSPATLYF